MLKKILPVIVICSVFGCAAQPREMTYRDYLMNEDMSLERGRLRTPQEIKEECTIIGRDLANLNEKLFQGKGPKSERVRKEALGEIKWLKKRAVQIECEEDFSRYPKTFQDASAESAEKPSSGAAGSTEIKNESSANNVSLSEPKPGIHEKKTTPAPAAEHEAIPARVSMLSFDECFQKCKDLTSRTNEQCFDTCLGAR